MKFSLAAVIAAASLAVASAQDIGISDPTNGTVWTAGQPGYISWTRNCAVMGNASHAVQVQLVDGPSTAVRFVSNLGYIDCSGTTLSSSITVPTNVSSGIYSLRIETQPTNSYSQTFQLNNPSMPGASSGTPATTTSANAPAATTTKPSAGNSLVAGAMVAFVGGAAAAFQLLL